ncbi:ABC transporter ATP-binding protein [Hoeflea alexandrii]|uniref:ABC transporter ATP-binding protein n=1 Tax=Hoeflea alexandrii TaxID=288436 RepID=UPI0022AFA925|nr:oligopeptide/dipeptide ABC transporter ATP-binding protein [Hoeflea alexandrii]MCZ4292282.1 ATP-binding cassette domain-containing protein [Hoeflea alexandrii]
MSEPLLRVKNLKKFFKVRRGFPNPETVIVRALDGISFEVQRGQAFALVGESGCGKSTAGRTILRLLEPDEGSIEFDGREIVEADAREMRALRKRAQIIFQDPFSSLNPRMRVGNALAEPLLVHGLMSKKEANERICDLLEEVGLPRDAGIRFPHEFSGGQRQRLGIARALTLNPELIIADEPVSALDVSIQSQILTLLRDLQQRLNLSFIFISHDLGVVRYFCQMMAVMYLGKIIEKGPVPKIFDEPLHPYTVMLRDASPVPDPAARKSFERIEGEVPSAVNPPSGCHFHPRCPHAMDVCRKVYPDWIDVDAERSVACHLYADGRGGLPVAESAGATS